MEWVIVRLQLVQGPCLSGAEEIIPAIVAPLGNLQQCLVLGDLRKLHSEATGPVRLLNSSF